MSDSLIASLSSYSFLSVILSTWSTDSLLQWELVVITLTLLAIGLKFKMLSLCYLSTLFLPLDDLSTYAFLLALIS